MLRSYSSPGCCTERGADRAGDEPVRSSGLRRLACAGARSLGFSLDDIAEIMGLRDRREAPCRVILDLLEQKACEVARRIEALQRLEVDLRQLHQLGQTFPLDDVDGKACVCHLVSSRAGLKAYSSNND